MNAASAVGVIGAGTMGVGIAYVFAEAGCAVTVVEPDRTRAAAAHQTIVARADRLHAADRLPLRPPNTSGRPSLPSAPSMTCRQVWI